MPRPDTHERRDPTLDDVRRAAGAGLVAVGAVLLTFGGWGIVVGLVEVPTGVTEVVEGWWPVVLVAAGAWLVGEGRRPLGLVFVGLGVVSLLVHHLPGELFWPVALITAGLVVLVGTTGRGRRWLTDGSGLAFFGDREPRGVGADGPHELMAVFGDVSGHLADDVTDEVVGCYSLFGDVELIVPRDVVVEMHQTSVFGDVRAPEPPRGRAARTIRVRGTALFGDVRVRRV